MNLFKSLFCKHEYEFVRNIYGDEINLCGGHRSIWKCKKCGKEIYKDNLFLKSKEIIKTSLCNELERLTNNYHENVYYNWLKENDKKLNRIKELLIEGANKGDSLFIISLICDEEKNDLKNYIRFFEDEELQVGYECVTGQPHVYSDSPNNDNNKIKEFEFTIRWGDSKNEKKSY